MSVDTSITATVPNTATSGLVTVIEGGVTSNAAQFNIIEPATVRGHSPAAGPVGATVAITGAGFGATQSESTVNLTGATATTITNWSDTSITATVLVFHDLGLALSIVGINGSCLHYENVSTETL